MEKGKYEVSDRRKKLSNDFDKVVNTDEVLKELDIFDEGAYLVVLKKTGWSTLLLSTPIALYDEVEDVIFIPHFGGTKRNKDDEFIKLDYETYLQILNGKGFIIETTEFDV